MRQTRRYITAMKIMKLALVLSLSLLCSCAQTQRQDAGYAQYYITFYKGFQGEVVTCFADELQLFEKIIMIPSPVTDISYDVGTVVGDASLRFSVIIDDRLHHLDVCIDQGKYVLIYMKEGSLALEQQDEPFILD